MITDSANLSSAPNYSIVSPTGQIRVHVTRNRMAKVAWINQQWFAKHKTHSSFFATPASIEDWLISNFGVETGDVSGLKPYQSDRYGGTGGAPHGGSGRCINIGSFNSKGNGVTPLVPQNVPHSYSHGRLQFSQAIKQAIMSVICERVFPHGAVPVIAVLDLGMSYDFQRNGKPERCAAVVRPNFIRAAHLERSIFFGSAGFKGADQYQEAESVKNYCRWVLAGNTKINPARLAAPDIIVGNWVDRICDQLGYGRAHRIWGDHIVSSNVGIDGDWCDLELFQCLPNFGCCLNQVNNAFGAEANSICQTAKSLEFYLSKTTAKKTNRWANTASNKIERKIHDRFLFYSVLALTQNSKLTKGIQPLRDALSRLYLFDQTIRYDESQLATDLAPISGKYLQRRQKYIDELVLELDDVCQFTERDTAAQRAENFLKTKEEFYGYRLRLACKTIVDSIFEDRTSSPKEIQVFCDHQIKSFEA